MTNQLWLAVLSSSVITAVVAAIIAGIYSLRTKRNEYVNDYCKTVLQRRIAAYETLERLIINLKTSVLDTDRRPYHLIFSDDNDSQSAHDLMFNVLIQTLWVTNEAFEKTQELNHLLFSLPQGAGVIEFGKANYQRIATIRADLEAILAKDMLDLYDVKHFLKTKTQRVHEFVPVVLGSQSNTAASGH